MDGDGVAMGGGCGGKEVIVYVLWGSELDDGSSGKLTYVEGGTKCMVLKEDIGLEEV